MPYSAAVQRRQYHAKRALGLCVKWGCVAPSGKFAKCLKHRAKEAPQQRRWVRAYRSRQEQQAA